jgi:Zn-dependent protease with chaperone function
MSEVRRLRRIEFALAAYGTAIVLMVLATGIDTIRFHLATALASGVRPSLQDVAVIVLAAADVAIVAAASWLVAVQIRRSGTFLRRLRTVGTRSIRGRRFLVIEDAEPRAFCAGLLRPRVHVSTGAMRVLNDRELLAVVAHETHHARRRDPLRLVVLRALTRSLPWAPGLRRLTAQHATVTELAADAFAIRTAGPRRHLASALLAVADHGGRHARGIAPERVDHLMGRLPRRGAPDWMLVSAGLSLALLSIAVVIGVVPGGRDVCSAMVGAPAPLLAACLSVVVVMSPVYLVARSAAGAVRTRD